MLVRRRVPTTLEGLFHSSQDDVRLQIIDYEAVQNTTRAGKILASKANEQRYDYSSRAEEALSQDQPRITEGPAKFIAGSDEYLKDCLVLLVTERMIEVFNNIAENDRCYEAAETALRRLEDREYRLQHLVAKSKTTDSSGTSQDCDPKETNRRCDYSRNWISLAIRNSVCKRKLRLSSAMCLLAEP